MQAASNSGLEHRAETESVALFLTHWRVSLIAVFMLTVIGMFAWRGMVPWHISAAWCGSACLGYLGQVIAALNLERAMPMEQAMPRWMPLLLASIGLSSMSWGMVPWMFWPDGTNAMLFASLFNTMLAFCIANAHGTVSMLRCATLPISVLTSAALLTGDRMWQAGAACGALFGVTVLYGVRLQHAIRASMTQRLAAKDLADDLQAHQQKLVALEREHAVLEEREQLMRAMHDGLGSTLISSLTLAERGELDAKAMAEVLRECLDDVHLVLESLERAEHDLATLLGTLRHRWGKRLAVAGLRLEWAVDDLPPLPWLTPPAALQVLRIVQEVLANVIKHAQAGILRIAAQADEGCVRLSVEDNGIGFDPEAVTPGRGLRHLRKRASQLGGMLTIDSQPGRGTRVRLELPVPHLA